MVVICGDFNPDLRISTFTRRGVWPQRQDGPDLFKLCKAF